MTKGPRAFFFMIWESVVAGQSAPRRQSPTEAGANPTQNAPLFLPTMPSRLSR
jgi:hypothetical protein